MRRYPKIRLDLRMLRQEILVELLSGTGTAGELWERIPERLGTDVLADGDFEPAIASLVSDGLVRSWPRYEFPILELTGAGIARAQRLRQTIFAFFCTMRDTQPEFAERMWRRQVIRKP